jgi:hypothetical protein
MHFRTHVKPESLGQSGRWMGPYADAMIDHDRNALMKIILGTAFDVAEALRPKEAACVRATAIEAWLGAFRPRMEHPLDGLRHGRAIMRASFEPRDQFRCRDAPTATAAASRRASCVDR